MSRPSLALDAALDPTATHIALHAAPLYPRRNRGTPERWLAYRVIEQALDDALSAHGSYCDECERLDARAFMDDWRLEVWCHAVGIEPSRVRAEYQRRLGARLLSTQDDAPEPVLGVQESLKTA